MTKTLRPHHQPAQPKALERQGHQEGSLQLTHRSLPATHWRQGTGRTCSTSVATRCLRCGGSVRPCGSQLSSIWPYLVLQHPHHIQKRSEPDLQQVTRLSLGRPHAMNGGRLRAKYFADCQPAMASVFSVTTAAEEHPQVWDHGCASDVEAARAHQGRLVQLLRRPTSRKLFVSPRNCIATLATPHLRSCATCYMLEAPLMLFPKLPRTTAAPVVSARENLRAQCCPSS